MPKFVQNYRVEIRSYEVVHFDLIVAEDAVSPRHLVVQMDVPWKSCVEQVYHYFKVYDSSDIN